MLFTSPYNDGFSIPEIDITTLLLDRNLKDSAPSKPAIIDGNSGRIVYTYQTLRENVRTFGAFLQQEIGVRPGDVVGYLSFNTVSLLHFDP